MKSEHRRELHTNELQRLAGQVGPFFEKHGRTILIGMLAAALVAVGIWFWVSRSGGSAREGWAAIANVVAKPAEERAEAYIAIARRHKGTEAAAWARLLAAEAQLQDGIRAAFNDREAAEKSLESAKENFELARDAQGGTDVHRQRALYGLAVCLETMADTSEAIEVYNQLLEEYPDTVYKQQVEERIAALKKDSMKEFYAFFEEHRPDVEDPLKLPQEFLNDSGIGGGLGTGGGLGGLPADHPPIGNVPPFGTPGAGGTGPMFAPPLTGEKTGPAPAKEAGSEPKSDSPPPSTAKPQAEDKDSDGNGPQLETPPESDTPDAKDKQSGAPQPK